MNRLACQYAVIRFLPYAETGEFANVGVALACPEAGYFGTRLLPAKKTGRITGFFDQLDKRIYRDAMNYLRQELNRIRVLVSDRHTRDRDFVRQVFAELIRPRESLLRFGETRVILAEDPLATLGKLFATLVERDFANKAYHDQLLVRRVRETLRAAKLREYFQEAMIGDGDLYMRVPFVHERDGRPQLAIKPLDLAKAEANQVYEVGGRLVDRVRRLRKHHLLPEAMLFTVDLPSGNEDRVLLAANEIMDDLRGNDIVRAVPMTDMAAITNFAQRAASN
ncbi:MAG: DUF3037 domain-containing protein [Gammaproteobacteria bacterium]